MGLLHKAIDDLEKVKTLLVQGVDVNDRDDGLNRTPLHVAAANNAHQTVAELLIANGADVNAKSMNDNTPLHVAAMQNAQAIAELLIANGADVNAKDRFGLTPLDKAKFHNATAMVSLLKSKGGKSIIELLV